MSNSIYFVGHICYILFVIATKKLGQGRGAEYIMYSNEEIMEFVSLVAEVVEPDRIILFGSYAYGVPTDKSDIDLLVIKNGKDFTINDETEYAVAIHRARMRRQIKPRYDVFFGTDDQIIEIASRGGSYVDALQRGKVVYERL